MPLNPLTAAEFYMPDRDLPRCSNAISYCNNGPVCLSSSRLHQHKHSGEEYTTLYNIAFCKSWAQIDVSTYNYTTEYLIIHYSEAWERVIWSAQLFTDYHNYYYTYNYKFWHPDSDLGLGQHEYVKQCQKLRTDVKLVLVEKPPNRNKTMDHPLPQGGNTAAGGSCISQDEANSLLNSYYAKEQKFRSVLESHENMVS